jgi:hypothetical protein
MIAKVHHMVEVSPTKNSPPAPDLRRGRTYHFKAESGRRPGD